MMVMQPSKGDSHIAQSFLANTATQAPTLPAITAPQGNVGNPVPMPQPLGPQFGAMFTQAAPAKSAGGPDLFPAMSQRGMVTQAPPNWTYFGRMQKDAGGR